MRIIIKLVVSWQEKPRLSLLLLPLSWVFQVQTLYFLHLPLDQNHFDESSHQYFILFCNVGHSQQMTIMNQRIRVIIIHMINDSLYILCCKNIFFHFSSCFAALILPTKCRSTCPVTDGITFSFFLAENTCRPKMQDSKKRLLAFRLIFSPFLRIEFVPFLALNPQAKF